MVRSGGNGEGEIAMKQCINLIIGIILAGVSCAILMARYNNPLGFAVYFGLMALIIGLREER
jgi:hypothetical protein